MPDTAREEPGHELGAEATGLHHLLTYLPAFRVVVCRSCQFAIQPSALSSHLLRHQIYRNERRTILNRFQKLQLWEPELVPVPPSSISPIPELSIHSGLKCMAGGCEHACVAQKRMSQHWSDYHHEPDSRNVKSRPALLQTFFRGNKIRYFEVSSPPSDRVTSTPDPEGVSHGSTGSPHGVEVPGFLNSFAAQDPRHDSTTSSPNHLPRNSPSPQPPVVLDMDVLRLLHHYTISTALNINRGSESHEFWSTTIPQEAFSCPFLMYGILGISAIHLAASPSTTDLLQVREFREAALNYQSLALPLYRTAMNNPTLKVANALIAFARLICIQHCAMDQVEDKLAVSWPTSRGDGNGSSYSSASTPSRGEPSTLPIIEGIYLVKGHIEALLALQPVLPCSSGFILPPTIRTGLEGKAPLNQSSSASPGDMMAHFPRNLQAVLLPLPKAIARSIADAQSSFTRSKVSHLSDEAEMSIITEATSIMETSYSISYASSPSPVEEIWNGIESCLIRFNKDFLDMIEAAHPTALLLISFWILLLKRQELNYWFLVGQSTRLLKCVLANLDKTGEEHRIVEALLNLHV